MPSERVVAAVQRRIPIVGRVTPVLVLSGISFFGHPPIGQGADMGAEPIFVTLGPGHLGISQSRDRAGTRENPTLAEDAVIDDAQPSRRPDRLQRLAGAMLPAHRRRSRASLPGVEMRAKWVSDSRPDVGLNSRHSSRSVRRGRATPFQPPPNPAMEVRMARVGGGEQTMVELSSLSVAAISQLSPAAAARSIVLHRRARDPHAVRHRRVAQPQPLRGEALP